ncbi:MAG: hypothetical protein V4510_07280 [bacterium]
MAKFFVRGLANLAAVAAVVRGSLPASAVVEAQGKRMLKVRDGKARVNVFVKARAKKNDTRITVTAQPAPWAMPFMAFGAIGGALYGLSISTISRDLSAHLTAVLQRMPGGPLAATQPAAQTRGRAPVARPTATLQNAAKTPRPPGQPATQRPPLPPPARR